MSMSEVVQDVQSHPIETGSQFAALRKVWAYEIADIDDRLVLGDKEGFQRWYQNMGKKVDPNTQNMFLNLIPGGAAAAILVGSIGVSIDGFKDYELRKAADGTERLLATESLGISQLNWDSVEYLLAHCAVWLKPLLEGRLESLQTVALAGGSELATERAALYERAVAEVHSAMELLKRRLEDHRQDWRARQEAYSRSSAEKKSQHKAKLNEVELLAKALLIDREIGEARAEEINGSFRRLRCDHTTLLLSDCDRLATDDTPFCLEHKCFKEGCGSQSTKGSHYCKDHGAELEHVEAFFPKFCADRGLKPAKQTKLKPMAAAPTVESTPPQPLHPRRKPRFPGLTVLWIIPVLLVPLVLLVQYVGERDSSATGDRRSTASNPPSIRYETLSSSELSDVAKQLTQVIEKADEKIGSLETVVHQLEPSLKAGDQEHTVATAKSILAAMDERVVHIATRKDALSKLLRVLDVMISDSTKLPHGVTLDDPQKSRSQLVEAVNDAQNLHRASLENAAVARRAFGDMLATSMPSRTARDPSKSIQQLEQEDRDTRDRQAAAGYDKETVEAGRRVWDKVVEEERAKANIYQEERVREQARRSLSP
jgi:hypothetical protein